MTDLKPFELLKEELTNEDVHVRVNAMHRVTIVATLIGPEASSRDLLDFLASTF